MSVICSTRGTCQVEHAGRRNVRARAAQSTEKVAEKLPYWALRPRALQWEPLCDTGLLDKNKSNLVALRDKVVILRRKDKEWHAYLEKAEHESPRSSGVLPGTSASLGKFECKLQVTNGLLWMETTSKDQPAHPGEIVPNRQVQWNTQIVAAELAAAVAAVNCPFEDDAFAVALLQCCPAGDGTPRTKDTMSPLLAALARAGSAAARLLSPRSKAERPGAQLRKPYRVVMSMRNSDCPDDLDQLIVRQRLLTPCMRLSRIHLPGTRDRIVLHCLQCFIPMHSGVTRLITGLWADKSSKFRPVAHRAEALLTSLSTFMTNSPVIVPNGTPAGMPFDEWKSQHGLALEGSVDLEELGRNLEALTQADILSLEPITLRGRTRAVLPKLALSALSSTPRAGSSPFPRLTNAATDALGLARRVLAQEPPRSAAPAKLAVQRAEGELRQAAGLSLSRSVDAGVDASGPATAPPLQPGGANGQVVVTAQPRAIAGGALSEVPSDAGPCRDIAPNGPPSAATTTQRAQRPAACDSGLSASQASAVAEPGGACKTVDNDIDLRAAGQGTEILASADWRPRDGDAKLKDEGMDMLEVSTSSESSSEVGQLCSAVSGGNGAPAAEPVYRRGAVRSGRLGIAGGALQYDEASAFREGEADVPQRSGDELLALLGDGAADATRTAPADARPAAEAALNGDAGLAVSGVRGNGVGAVVAGNGATGGGVDFRRQAASGAAGQQQALADQATSVAVPADGESDARRTTSEAVAAQANGAPTVLQAPSAQNGSSGASPIVLDPIDDVAAQEATPARRSQASSQLENTKPAPPVLDLKVWQKLIWLHNTSLSIRIFRGFACVVSGCAMLSINMAIVKLMFDGFNTWVGPMNAYGCVTAGLLWAATMVLTAVAYVVDLEACRQLRSLNDTLLWMW